MGEPCSIAVAGVAGRMGRMLVETIGCSERAQICGASEKPGHSWIGRDLGECVGGAPSGIAVCEDPVLAFKDAAAVIDFTSPEATAKNAAAAAELGCAFVSGATGLTEAELSAVADASKRTAVVRAGNMSLGINLLTSIAKSVAKALDEDFDIEIVEAHHRQKVDSPSGTALMLGEAAAEGRGTSLKDCAIRGRDGITGARPRGSIGFSAIRGGDIVGEHDVVFAGDGERITIRHVATDRAVYARGALKAALWAVGRPAGQYNMRDVLGI